MALFLHRFSLLHRNRQGAVAIGFALMTPMLLLLLIGVLEMGVYFVKYEAAQRAVNTISRSIQGDPLNTDLDDLAASSTSGLVNFNAPNYICANAYTTVTEARAKLCGDKKEWNTKRPDGLDADAAYYVAVVAWVKNESISEFISLPDLQSTNIIQIGSDGKIPTCNLPNQALHADKKNKFACLTTPDFPPTCTGDLQTVKFNGTNFTCGDVIPPGSTSPPANNNSTTSGFCVKHIPSTPNCGTTVSPSLPATQATPESNCGCQPGWSPSGTLYTETCSQKTTLYFHDPVTGIDYYNYVDVVSYEAHTCILD